MTVRGRLRSETPKPDKARVYTIEAAGQVWSVDCSAGETLKNAALKLVDEPVVLVGDLKFTEDSSGNDVATIVAIELKAAEEAVAAPK